MVSTDEEFLRQLSNLQLKEKSSLSLEAVEEDYVLDIAVQQGCSTDRQIAATSSNNTIRLLSYSDLSSTRGIKGHSNVITGVQFGRTEPNLLFSSSFDQTVRCWDIRTDLKKAVQTLEGPDEVQCVFTSFDVNCDDRVVCAGTECSKKDDDAHILFWDRRQGRLLGAYSDSHEDDITQIKFHPSDKDKLATGSTDGLVCVFDVSQASEDDAIQLTLNSESSVAQIGWCGADGNNVYCVTHIDTVYVWDADNDGEDVKTLTDIKDELKDAPVDYLVDCVCTDDGAMYVAAGTHSGDVRLLDVAGETPSVITTLSGGHNATVRVIHWDQKACNLITGGEDSFLCLWSKNGTTLQSSTKSKKVKLKMKKSVTKKSRPY